MTLLAVAILAPAFANPPAVEETPAGIDPEAAAAADALAAAPGKDHVVSVLVQAMAVPGTLVSADVQVALARRFALAGRGGIGMHEDLPLYDVGVEGRYFVAGDFDGGFFVGAGLGRTNLTPDTVGDTAHTAHAFLGARYVNPIGFTIEGAAGFGGYRTEHLIGFSPTGRVGVGWSF